MNNKLKQSVLDDIGNTPLFQIEEGIFAKAEFMNPSGSVKARMAKYIIEQAEKEGLLKPGDTIVEATSGNTGNAMSMVAAAKGYKILVIIPEGYTSERVQISRGFGAEIKFIGNFQVNEAREEALRLGEQDGYYCPAQFDNQWNADENRDWLGKEIIEQLPEDVKIDAFVQGVGTGGTLVGVGEALKKWHNPDVKIIAMEPAECRTLELGTVDDHQIEGISDGFVPTIFERNRAIVDSYMPVKGDIAIEETKKLASEKGHFVGPSSGAHYWAAKKLKEDNPELKNILILFCDRGEKYLSILHPE